MKQILNNSRLVEKEFIQLLNVCQEDVLKTDFEREKRKEKLCKALLLGNLDKQKVKIYFQDNLEVRFVETTVWGVTECRVILKSGIVIPINRVIFVKLI